MKIIEKMICHLEEEMEGATEYAEKYIECKARGNMARASKYREMASDELKHAAYLRDFDVADIDEMKKIYPLTEEVTEMWEKAHRKINEKMALINHMLTM